MEMEQMTIYKKDVGYHTNGKVDSFHTFITYLTGAKKGQKIRFNNMTNARVEDLIGKIFFGKTAMVNGREYIIDIRLMERG
jgi:hypothetical protein